MDTMQALDTFTRSIESNEEARKGWADEITWSRGRRAEWGSDRIRIGVIGVTSSGKSTLINAILGKEILSSAVAPSSSQLVCCTYGETPGITVHFKDGSSKRLEGADYSLAALQEYSDERFNRGNKKGVLAIELTSPHFDLGHDVVLVDSPGLDAYGLEAHERLTLESLVPTMDLCICITTTKTNSDEKTRRILDVVAKYHCPIVIVQNMADAVKPSADGEKSREEVAADHRKRLQRIVDASQVEDKNTVEIVQMSSKYAVYERVPGTAPAENPEGPPQIPSNYEGFVEAVNRVLSQQRPVIDRQRLLSIRDRAHDIAAEAEQQMDTQHGGAEASLPLQDLAEHTRSQEDWVRDSLDSLNRQFDMLSSSVRNDLSGGKVSKDTLRKSLGRVNRLVDTTSDGLLDIVQKHNAFVESAAADLRRPSRDLQCPVSLRSFGEIREVQKTETRTRKVEKEGFFRGKAARLFGKWFGKGDWGYDYVDYEETVTDKTATRQAIERRLDEAGGYFAQTTQNWLAQRFEPSMKLIQDDIDAARSSYKKRGGQVMWKKPLEKLRDDMRSLARSIDSELQHLPAPERPAEHHAKQPETEEKMQVEVSDLTAGILLLAREAVQKQHIATYDAMHENLGTAGLLPVIISWDRGSLEEFVWQTGLDGAQKIESPKGEVHLPEDPSRGRCVFVLVNTPQYGAARKQIEELHLADQLTEDDFVVWVVQDFQELLNTECSVEGIEHMLGLREIAARGRSIVYLSHGNPVYNLGLLKYQLSESYRLEPGKLMNKLQTTFGIYTTQTAEKELGTMFRRLKQYF